jgi:hypothetical protein
MELLNYITSYPISYNKSHKNVQMERERERERERVRTENAGERETAGERTCRKKDGRRHCVREREALGTGIQKKEKAGEKIKKRKFYTYKGKTKISDVQN